MKKTITTTMTHEEITAVTNRILQELAEIITHDCDTYEADTSGDVIFIEDKTALRSAIYSEIEAAMYKEDSDIIDFLERHGIEYSI